MRKEGEKYSTSGNIEAEFEPGGRVLKNKLDIRSKKEMDRLEYEALLEVQERYYRIVTPQTRFTSKFFLQMHKDFLGRLYSWAGHYRTVNLEKSGFKWPPAYLVDQNMSEFEKNILARRTPCRRGPIGRIAKDIAIVHAELLLIHPFRDGNGRLARLAANLMALQAGLAPLDFSFDRKGNRSRYLQAVSQGYLGNHTPLTRIVMKAIGRGADDADNPV